MLRDGDYPGGIISIDKGRWQAARAIGMTYAEMMWHIILPQAVHRMVPPFMSQSVIQFKNTALLYVVAVPDLMYTGYLVVADTYRPLEVYTGVAVVYFIILYPLTQWGNAWRREVTSSDLAPRTTPTVAARRAAGEGARGAAGRAMFEVRDLCKSYGEVETDSTLIFISARRIGRGSS